MLACPGIQAMPRLRHPLPSGIFWEAREVRQVLAPKAATEPVSQNSERWPSHAWPSALATPAIPNGDRSRSADLIGCAAKIGEAGGRAARGDRRAGPWAP